MFQLLALKRQFQLFWSLWVSFRSIVLNLDPTKPVSKHLLTVAAANDREDDDDYSPRDEAGRPLPDFLEDFADDDRGRRVRSGKFGKKHRDLREENPPFNKTEKKEDDDDDNKPTESGLVHSLLSAPPSASGRLKLTMKVPIDFFVDLMDSLVEEVCLVLFSCPFLFISLILSLSFLSRSNASVFLSGCRCLVSNTTPPRTML
jgi:hypothetical protein